MLLACLVFLARPSVRRSVSTWQWMRVLSYSFCGHWHELKSHLAVSRCLLHTQPSWWRIPLPLGPLKVSSIFSWKRFSWKFIPACTKGLSGGARLLNVNLQCAISCLVLWFFLCCASFCCMLYCIILFSDWLLIQVGSFSVKPRRHACAWTWIWQPLKNQPPVLIVINEDPSPDTPHLEQLSSCNQPSTTEQIAWSNNPYGTDSEDVQ